jgi:ribosomal protein L32E
MAKKFIRKDTHKKKRLSLVWRKPKGITNKRRLSRNGHATCVRPGFGTKASDRGKNKQGLMIVSVATLDQLKKINPKTQAALLAGVGKKRKIELMNEAEKLKITLVNFNAKLYKENTAKFLAEKKQDSEKKQEDAKKEAKKEEENKSKKAEAKKEAEEEQSQEDKKKAENSVEKNSSSFRQREKEERDKVLIKK